MSRRFFNAIHDRWADLHGFFRLVLALGFFGGVGLVLFGPGLRGVREWRVERNLNAARQAVEGVRMEEARDLALTVLRAGDPRIDALRILEKSMDALKDPRHGDAARALIGHPEGTDEDRLRGFRGVVGEVALGLAGQAWVALPEHCRRDARFAVAFADRLLAEGCVAEAAEVLMGLPAEDASGEVERRLIRVLIGSGKREGLGEAQRLIAQGIQAGDGEAGDWLDLLEEMPVLSLEERHLGAVRSWLAVEEGAERERRGMKRVRLDYATGWAERGVILDRAVAKWRERSPVLLAGLLADLGLYRRMVEEFPASAVAAEPELLRPVLRAAALCGEWDLVVDLVFEHGERLSPHEEAAYRALWVAGTTSETRLRADAWDTALVAAAVSPDPGAFLELQRIAADAGMVEEADQAMVEAIRSGRGPLPLYRGQKEMLGRLVRRERENLLMEICAIYLAFEPANPVLLTQYAYLACLNGLVDPAEVLRAVRPMAEAFPNEWPMQLVVMAAHLAAGDAAAAGEVLDELPVKVDELAPGYRALALATEVRLGRVSEEDARVREFPRSALLPSERRRFAEWARREGG